MIENRALAAPVPLRTADLAALFAAVRDLHCVSLVGVSNLGKSAILRAMTNPHIQTQHLADLAREYLFIYVDFNQMLELTEQAFYELTLRCALDVLRIAAAAGDVRARVQSAYDSLVAPTSSFGVPLSFATAMAAIGDQLPQKVVFLFDEIDGPLASIDGRVFLNLRALKDRHSAGFSCITATNRRLTQIRQDNDVSEFEELFAHHTHYLAFLSDPESALFVDSFAAQTGVTFSDEDRAFIRLWAGGHPGLLDSTCRLLGSLTGRPVRAPSQDVIIHRRAAELLSHDINVQSECRKIWNDLTPAEQEALLALPRSSDENEPPEMNSVQAKHLVIGEGPERRIFARAFADYVQRQQVRAQAGPKGIQIDLESGEVWLDGNAVPTLTNLEYRLLLLLYGRMSKICNKYEVVEAVWGEDYIDDVDDARIEKLVSRLRQKLEPDVANPRHLITVRGRGYKLV